MNNVDKVYLAAVQECLDTGTRKPNRTGVDTISTFNINYEIDLAQGFPLLTTKKISWKNIVVEMLWFLSGEKNIGFLKKHKCKFWDDWADENDEVPSAYGNFWRSFPIHPEKPQDPGESWRNDQLEWIQTTLRENPMSRRMVVSAWAPGNAQTSKLPPCHCQFIFNVQIDQEGTKRLCCHLTQRSCDLALGVPYNIASYALLTHLFAQFANMEVGIFAHTLVDAHIYTSNVDGSMSERPDGSKYSTLANHIPGLKKQLVREPRDSPILSIAPYIQSLEDIKPLFDLSTESILDKFHLRGYNPHPAIKFEVAI